ncbi:MAG: alpha/beta hydrolase [Pseudomonadota bacterium]
MGSILAKLSAAMLAAGIAASCAPVRTADAPPAPAPRPSPAPPPAPSEEAGVAFERESATGGFIPSVYFDGDPESPCAPANQLPGPDASGRGYTCLEIFFGSNREFGAEPPSDLADHGGYPTDPGDFFADRRWAYAEQTAPYFRTRSQGEAQAAYETYATGRAFVTVPKRQPGDKLVPFEYKGRFGRTRTPTDEDREEVFTLAQYELMPGEAFWRRAGDIKAISLAGASQGGLLDWANDRGAVLVYVHGFNVGFDGAAYRTAQLAYDLQFAGVPMFFSWPANSSGNILSYFNDVSEASASVGDLKLFLKDVESRLEPTKYILLAHSHGNQVVLDALNELTAERGPDADPMFDAVIFASPDVDAMEFKRLAERSGSTAASKTLYASQDDRAIWVRTLLTRLRVPLIGQRIEEKPRAGHVPRGGRPLPVEGVDVIDVTQACTGPFGADEPADKVNHSKYADARDLISDIRRLIDDLWAPPPLAAPNERSEEMRATPASAPSFWRFRRTEGGGRRACG